MIPSGEQQDEAAMIHGFFALPALGPVVDGRGPARNNAWS
jgi:hypothetical protein